MNSRAMVRDDSMRRAALCSRLESRSRASYFFAAALLAVLLGVFCWQAFALPCIGGPSC
jgi:hypothetical protein